MNKEQIVKIEDAYSIAGFKKREISLDRAKDATLFDTDGKEYVDCVGGQGVCNIGHANPKVIEAIRTQAEKLIICPALFYNESRAKLIKKLVDISPDGLEKVFLCNSGAEAVESAIKFARISTGKKKIIAMMKGFHGRTLGALSATWKKTYREPFEPLVPEFSFVPFNNIEKLSAEITDNTAAVLLEIIQGEGGVNVGKRQYLEQVRELCDEKDVLLIVDEIQTGFGRTGEMFATPVKPDMMCVAKSIAAGIPMGAVLCSDKLKVPFGVHSTTFGGYPLTCEAALASIDVIEQEGLCQRAKELGEYFLSELNKIESSKIREIRGRGLMIGIEFKEKVVPYLRGLQDKGIVALAAGPTVLRFLPPLVITKEQIERVVSELKKLLE